jgi:hypothetical protein
MRKPHIFVSYIYLLMAFTSSLAAQTGVPNFSATAIVAHHDLGKRGDFVMLQEEQQLSSDDPKIRRSVNWYFINIPLGAGEANVFWCGSAFSYLPIGNPLEDPLMPLDIFLTPEGCAVRVMYSPDGGGYQAIIIRDGSTSGDNSGLMTNPPGYVSNEPMAANVDGSLSNGLTVTLQDKQHFYKFLWNRNGRRWALMNGTTQPSGASDEPGHAATTNAAGTHPFRTELVSRHSIPDRGDFVVLQFEEKVSQNQRDVTDFYLLLDGNNNACTMERRFAGTDNEALGVGAVGGKALVDVFITPENAVVEAWYVKAERSYEIHVRYDDGSEIVAKLPAHGDAPPHAHIDGSLSGGVHLTLGTSTDSKAFKWDNSRQTWGDH